MALLDDMAVPFDHYAAFAQQVRIWANEKLFCQGEDRAVMTPACLLHAVAMLSLNIWRECSGHSRWPLPSFGFPITLWSRSFKAGSPRITQPVALRRRLGRPSHEAGLHLRKTSLILGSCAFRGATIQSGLSYSLDGLNQRQIRELPISIGYEALRAVQVGRNHTQNSSNVSIIRSASTMSSCAKWLTCPGRAILIVFHPNSRGAAKSLPGLSAT